MEIFIVLYFKNKLDEEYDFITRRNYRQLLGIEELNALNESIESENRNSNNNINNNLENNIDDNLRSNYNNTATKTFLVNNKNNTGTINNDKNNYKSQKSTIMELKAVKDKILSLIESFKNIIDYCLNNFKRKYDINISPGKPLYYRQKFLSDKCLFRKTLNYLDFTINANKIYNEYREYAKKRFEEEEEAEKLRNTLHIDTRKNTIKTFLFTLPDFSRVFT